MLKVDREEGAVCVPHGLICYKVVASCADLGCLVSAGQENMKVLTASQGSLTQSLLCLKLEVSSYTTGRTPGGLEMIAVRMCSALHPQ